MKFFKRVINKILGRKKFNNGLSDKVNTKADALGITWVNPQLLEHSPIAYEELKDFRS